MVVVAEEQQQVKDTSSNALSLYVWSSEKMNDKMQLLSCQNANNSNNHPIPIDFKIFGKGRTLNLQAVASSLEEKKINKNISSKKIVRRLDDKAVCLFGSILPLSMEDYTSHCRSSTLQQNYNPSLMVTTTQTQSINLPSSKKVKPTMAAVATDTSKVKQAMAAVATETSKVKPAMAAAATETSTVDTDSSSTSASHTTNQTTIIAETKAKRNLDYLLNNSNNDMSSIETMLPPEPCRIKAGSYSTAKPNDNDVLGGRGGRVNSHGGNVRCRQMVQRYKALYVDVATKQFVKHQICSNIVEHMRSLTPSGHFLEQRQQASGEFLWVEIGDERARKKVAQALREDATELRAEIQLSKQKKYVV